MATIPGLVLSHTQKQPDAVALRYKQLGIWNSYSWSNYLSEVTILSNALKNLSIKKGSVVAIYGNNVPKLIFSISAIQSLGGVVVPIHPESTSEELKKILNSSKAETLIAEDQQQVDTFLTVENDCNVKNVIYLDGRGMTTYKNDKLNSYDNIISNSNDSSIENEINAINENDIAFYLYDEHEDSLYKVSHAAMINNSNKIVSLNTLTAKDSIVSYLPLSIPTNLLFTFVTSLASGMSLNLPESNQTIEKDLQEIGPTILYAPSFVFKHIITSISYRIESATQSNYDRYMGHYKLLMEIYEREVGGNASVIDRIRKTWIMLSTFSPAKNVFGLTKIKHAFVSDGVLSKVNFDFFHAIGVEIQHSFGQAVSCGCIAVQPDHSVSSENVGSAMAGTEIKINDSSEVIFKTDCMAESLDNNDNTNDGWVNSGFVGSIDDSGNIVISGRKEDIVTLKSGKQFSPESIENLISCSPFVKSSLIVGNGQDGNSVIVVIDPNSVNSWADRKNIRYTGYTELASKDEVRDLIKEHISCVNETLESELKIKRFVVLHRTLIMSQGEVSKTMEVMRKNIEVNLKDVFSAIENNKDNCKVNDIDQLSYELNINKI
jgi:long-chain acyl-CoA synthetase|tara:strand:+ start:8011 stop:9822 length:1812 start_codon:yes stop_codon:yes gene_type:complete